MAPSAPISSTPQCRLRDEQVNASHAPLLAPIGLREGAKVYKLTASCLGSVLEYKSLDGSTKYTKQDEGSGAWIPVKREGETWTTDNLQAIQLIYTSVLDETAFSNSKGKTPEAAQKDREYLQALRSGDKDKIKSVFKDLGWGEPSNETSNRLEFTKVDTGAQVTYYLSDNKKRWSTVRPQWFFDQYDRKGQKEAVHHDESLVAFKVDPRTGRVSEEVKKRAGVDVYYNGLQVQGWRDKKSHAFDYITKIPEYQPKARISSIGVTYGLPSIVNSKIITTQPFKLPDEVPYTLHNNYLFETNIDVAAGGGNFRFVPVRISDLIVPPSDPTGLNKNHYTSGNIVTAGFGVVNHNKTIEQEGMFRFMEDSSATAQVGALQMVDGRGESHWIPVFLLSNDRTVVRFQPNKESGPAFKIGFRTEAIFPMTDGGVRTSIENPTMPPMTPMTPMTPPMMEMEEKHTWAEALAIKNGLYLTVGAEWVLSPKTNRAALAYLYPEKQKVTGGEVAQGVIGNFLNAGVQLGSYTSNVDIYGQRRKSGEDNYDFFGTGNYLSATIPALLVYGPQDVADGEMAARMSNTSAAIYFGGKALGVLAAAIPAAMVTRDHVPTNYSERVHFATVPLAMREGAGLGTQLAIFLKERVADKLNLSNGERLALDEGVAGAFLVIGLTAALAPRALIPGKASDTRLGNVQFGEHFSNRQDPEAIWTWASMDGNAAAGAGLVGAALNIAASGAMSYRNRSERKKMQEAIRQSTSVTRDEKGPVIPPPVPLVEKVNLNLDTNSTGAVARVGAQGNGEFLFVPGGARPKGRLDTEENRTASRVEALKAKQDKLKIRLAALEGVLEKEPDAVEALLKSRRDRAERLRGEVSELQEQIDALASKTKKTEVGSEERTVASR